MNMRKISARMAQGLPRRKSYGRLALAFGSSQDRQMPIVTPRGSTEVLASQRTLQDFQSYFDTPLYDLASDSPPTSLLTHASGRRERPNTETSAQSAASSAMVPNEKSIISHELRRRQLEVRVTN